MMKRYKVLIVDDELEMLESFKKLFLRKTEFIVELENDYNHATKKLEKNKYDLLLADLKIKKDSGIELCKIAKAKNPNISVLIISGYGTIDSGVEAVKAGAVDFIQKPFSAKLLFSKIDSALPKQSIQKDFQNFHGLIYKSQEMIQIIETLKKVSIGDVNIMINGESGTGKELIARSLHALSNRKKESFIPINCGAIPENLFESELFGHEKGAFTGALATKPGILEFANRGTIFFDEITEMPIALQPKLLRTIEDGKIRRLGAKGETQLDLRIVSATNVNPLEAIESKKLRNDLYYRLSSFSITIPPLRKRRDDILPIFNYYLEKICATKNIRTKQLSKNASEALKSYDWPGNIREIINVIQKLSIICTGDSITEDILPLPNIRKGNQIFSSLRSIEFKSAKDKILEEFEIDYLKHNLAKYNGNISKTAEECGIDRRTIHRMINKYNIIYKD